MHQAVGRLDVEFQTVALWLFLKQPTIAHIRANAARPFASCLLFTPAGFPRHRHSPWRPHPEKGVGVYLPSQRIAPGRRKPFFTAIRCRLFCPRWLPVVFCRTCRGAGGAGRAQRVCVDAGCPAMRHVMDRVGCAVAERGLVAGRLLVGRRGVIGPWLAECGINLIFSWQGAVVAATVVVFPLIYKSARAALELVDPRLENAARTLGASEWKVFWQVSLPLAWRGIVAGGMLAFARGMGEFGATLMIAGNIPGKTQTLALAIYDAFQAGNDAQATVLVVLTSCLCLTILVLADRLSGGKAGGR